MKDYLVHADDHAIEITCDTFRDAQKEAAWQRKHGFNDVIIDEYKDEELTGIYWSFDGANHLVKHP